jgi:4-amino-4-deoxy-L-arabinose transferase-like glycosyltransferase
MPLRSRNHILPTFKNKLEVNGPSKSWLIFKSPPVIVLFILASIAHLSFYWAAPSIFWPDSLRYAELSSGFWHRLVAGNWDLWTPPGYPFFLWICRHWIMTEGGVELVQQILAVGTCLFVWFSVRRIWGEQEAIIAGVVVALSPFRHYYAQAFLSESLAEYFFAGGICFLILSIDQPLRRMLASRVGAGLFLGATALVRANLAPAMFLACLVPTRYQNTGPWSRRFFLGMMSTCIAWLLVVLPWFAFNVNRSVYGLTGNLGYQLNSFANDFGIGEHVGMQPFLAQYTPEIDRELQDIGWQRFANHPRAYLQAVLRSAFVLFFPIQPWGDVAPLIPSCSTVRPDRDLNGFKEKPPHAGVVNLCNLHAFLCRPYKYLVSVGWLGLMIWWAVSLVNRRFDHVVLATIPLACVGALSLIIQANTRYAFPCELFALAFGLTCIFRYVKRCLAIPLQRKVGG